MSKLTILAAAAVGYVLGARAGRERYEEIAEAARGLWTNPTVQRQKDRTQEAAVRKGREAGRVVGAKAAEAGRKVGDTASDAVDRVRSERSDGSPGVEPDPDGAAARPATDDPVI